MLTWKKIAKINAEEAEAWREIAERAGRERDEAIACYEEVKQSHQDLIAKSEECIAYAHKLERERDYWHSIADHFLKLVAPTLTITDEDF